MAFYVHDHPRNFANECDQFRCDTREELEKAEASGYERLTREEMIRHIRWINLENDSMGSGRPFGRIDFREIPAWAEARELGF